MIHFEASTQLSMFYAYFSPKVETYMVVKRQKGTKHAFAEACFELLEKL